MKKQIKILITGQAVVHTQWDNVGINSFKFYKHSSEGVPLELTTLKRTYDLLYYPEDISSTDQDRINFQMFYISGRKDAEVLISNNFDPLGNREITTIVSLPTLLIPGGIQDENSVQLAVIKYARCGRCWRYFNGEKQRVLQEIF